MIKVYEVFFSDINLDTSKTRHGERKGSKNVF